MATRDDARTRAQNGETSYQGMNAKTCNRCGVTYPNAAESFHRNRAQADGLLTHCKPCRRKQELDRHHANKAKANAARRERYRANREAALKSFREHYQANKEAYIERNRRWVANNTLAARAQWNRRRARERNAVGTCSADAYEARWAYYGGKCWMCGDEAEEMDHVIPLAIRPFNWPANLRPACRACNASKSSAHPSTL